MLQDCRLSTLPPEHFCDAACVHRASHVVRVILGSVRNASQVQDFTQAELALDLRVVNDPNNLFYCGDTAQTIARGVGFRFEDIKVGVMCVSACC
jgi:hypothetical protein